MHLISRQLFLAQVVLLSGGTLSAMAKGHPAIADLALSYIARIYSMKTSTVGKKVVMKNRWNTIEVEQNSRRAWINGVMVWLHYPCRKGTHGWVIREVDYKKTIDPIMRSYSYLSPRIPKVVVLDPGHGGKDSGAVGKRKVYEKLAVLSIAKRVKAHLEAHKIKVLMTRSDDTFIPLKERNAYAKKVNADLFVSIHADGAGDSSANGVETFALTVAGFDSSNFFGKSGNKVARTGNKNDESNEVLAFSIQSNLLKIAKRSDRGVRRARFSVLKYSHCPAALVECGFLTNPTEEALMIDSKYREKVAYGISNGILGYITLAKRVRH